MEALVALYGILVNGGRFRPLVHLMNPERTKHAIQPPITVMSREAAYLVREMLSKNPRPGMPAIPTQVSSPAVAFKTGTSIGFKDCWSIGLFEGAIMTFRRLG